MIVNECDIALPVPSFRIVDFGTARSDLATRKEIKFTYEGADVGKFRSLLETNCRRLVHNNAVSVVRSIYFDDPMLSACRANLDGLGRRRKLRLRWYDTLWPGTTFFFEIKWRHNRVTGKHRLQIESDVPLVELSYKQIAAGLRSAIPAEYLGDLYGFYEPVMIVEYQREHFASDDGCFRVTLDYDLTFYDQTFKSRISTVFPQRLPRVMVLEGKSPIGREAELRRLLFPLQARVGRCSKYVHGCHLLGLLS
jgi:hypothetical protein